VNQRGAVPVHAFTTAYSRVVRVLTTEAHVGPPHDPRAGEPPPPLKSFQAIWDTGASASVITQQVVEALGLKPIGMTQVRHVQGVAEAEQYLITLRLPSNVGIAALRVTKGILSAGADMLIGMDVIANGDFAVTNFAGQTKLSFRLPSCEHIDFVQSGPPKPKPYVAAAKVGRNDPCPCGSGRKYKHCHGL
jgi:uncharacterized protein YchJ